MNFVSTTVYQAELKAGGVIVEKEIDRRTKEEKEDEERLNNLPEFRIDPSRLSRAEISYEEEGKNEEEKNEEQKPNNFGPPPVTEEEFEFLEALEIAEEKRRQQRKKEEIEMREEFARAQKEMFRKSLEKQIKKSTSDEDHNFFCYSKNENKKNNSPVDTKNPDMGKKRKALSPTCQSFLKDSSDVNSKTTNNNDESDNNKTIYASPCVIQTKKSIFSYTSKPLCRTSESKNPKKRKSEDYEDEGYFKSQKGVSRKDESITEKNDTAGDGLKGLLQGYSDDER